MSSNASTPSPPPVLDPIHRRGRVAQQRVAVVVAAAEGDAHAHGQHGLAALEWEGPGHLGLQPGGETLCGTQVGGPVEHHHELVAAEPAQQCALADQRLFETPGHPHQQLVAGLVAEAVVDDLEAVEIDQ